MEPQSPPPALSLSGHIFTSPPFPAVVKECKICVADPHTLEKMDTTASKECLPVGGSNTHTNIGGAKPLHRFLKGEPKSAGVVIMFVGSSLFMFGIPLKTIMASERSVDILSSFWLGILYLASGILYVLSERKPTKKIITASFALSILSTMGSAVAAIDFIVSMAFISRVYSHQHYYAVRHEEENKNSTRVTAVSNHYMPLYSLEAVFLFHCAIGTVIVLTMSIFARLALRSTQTQAVVVMRNLPATE